MRYPASEKLEIINLDPPAVDYAPQEEEDWGE